MDHKTLEAKAVATEQGEFTAIAAAYSVDRMNERILPGAFAKTIEAWQKSGKQIPLHWDHMTEAENIIGTVDPSSMREVDAGLEVKGKLDIDENATAKEAWRLMKRNAVALSFGYLVRSDSKAEDGVRELKDLDMFEITITPAPANPDTRFIDMKSVKAPETMADRLRAMADEVDDEAMAARMRELADAMAEMGKSLEAEAIWKDWAARNLVADDVKQCEGCGTAVYRQADSRDWEKKRFCPTCEEKRAGERAEPQAIEDGSEEPDQAKLPQDPLVTQYDETVFEITTRGLDTKQPVAEKAVDAEPPPTLEELESRLHGIELDILTRGEAI